MGGSGSGSGKGSGSRVWHPNTQMGEWDSFDEIKSAKGVWLTDSRGNRMIDAVASMWCNVWGHSDPQLVGAIAEQSRVLQHSSMFNLTNGPAEALAGELVGMSPGMHRVFYSDNGSSAMEVAIKIAIQYWQNSGERGRTGIAALENGYHGDTFGAMSVGYVPEFFGAYRSKLFGAARFPVPNGYRLPRGMTLSDREGQCLEAMERRLSGRDGGGGGGSSSSGEIAALVMESGAQVAGGVLIYPEGFQGRVARICRRHGVLLVLDEVATGLGRLGSMVEYERQGSVPDIVAYGKMLTGGYLTMAATLASKGVYDAFLGDFDDRRHLFHGHTYTGNPIAAAVAVKNLEMYRARRLIERIRETSRVFEEFYGRISEIGIVGDVRHRGMLMGIELVSDRRSKTPLRAANASLNRVFFEEGKRQGVYLRTLGNTVMLVPPLAIGRGELEMLLDRAARTIRAVADSL